MVISVCLVYGIKRERNEVIEWIKSCRVNGGIALGGYFTASLLKLIPGVGTIAGCIIDGIVGTSATGTLGYTTICFCESNFDFDKLRDWCTTAINNINSAIDGFSKIKEDFKQIETKKTAFQEKKANNEEETSQEIEEERFVYNYD